MIRRFTSRSGNQNKTFVSSPVNVKAINLPSSLIRRGGITLLALLLSLFVVQNRLQAQCTIAPVGSSSFDLSLDEFGVATINSTLLESHVSSSGTGCHPDNGGILNLYGNQSKTVVFLSTSYDCADLVPMNTAVTVYVALEDGFGNESGAIPFTITIVDAYAPDLMCPLDVMQTLQVSNSSTTYCDAIVNNLTPLLATDNCNGMVLSYQVTGAGTTLLADNTGNGDASGKRFNAGVSTITYTATDAAVPANVNTCSSTVTVSFPQPYDITNCSPNIIVDVDPGLCTKTVIYPTPNEINDCSVVFTAASTNPGSGSSLTRGTYPVSFNFNNGADNVTCSFVITVEDNENPVVITGQQSITTTGCEANYAYNAASDISDNCTTFGNLDIDWTMVGANVSISGTGALIPNTLLSIGDYQVVFTVADQFNNTVIHPYTVSVLENVAPVAMAMDITVSLDINGAVTVNASDLDAGSTDNCGVMSFEIAKDLNTDNMPDNTVGGPAGDWLTSITYGCMDLGGINPVVFHVLDANGNISNTLTANVTVEDNLAPVAFCDDFTVTLMGGVSQNVTAADIDAGSSDNCNSIANRELKVDTNGDGIFDFTYAQYVTDGFYEVTCPTPTPTGFLNVKMRVTDGSMETAECIAKINVLDGTAPVVAAKNVTVNLNALGQIQVNASQFNNGSTEDCADASVITYTYAQGQNGNYTVSKPYDCSVLAGTPTNNSNSRLYSNIYLKGTNPTGLSDVAGPVNLVVRDITAPTARCFFDLTVSYDTAGDISVPATALDSLSTDNCSIKTWRVSDSATGPFNAATYTGNCTVPPAKLFLQVSDANINSLGRNSSVCETNIIIEDNIPPTAICHSNLSVSLITGTVVVFASQVDGGSADACNSAAPLVAITRVLNGNPGTYSNSITFDCNDVSGLQMVRLRATDGVGLTSTCNSYIDVQETQPPVFGASFPASPQTVQCENYSNNTSLPFDAAAIASATDNCGTVTVTFNDTGNLVPNACSPSTITRTYTATDSSDNSSTRTITMIVIDTMEPTFTRPADMVIECLGSEILPNFPTSGGQPTDEEDNCDAQVTEGGLREATSDTYHGFFDFKNHIGDVATAYNFAPSQWLSSNTLTNVNDAPALIKLTSTTGVGQTDFSINVPATGWIVFDYSTSTSGAATNDPFGYSINGVFTVLAAAQNATRAIVPVTSGQTFAFSQKSINGANGSATTTVRSFTFVDVAITAPQPIVCANNFDIARFWSLDDCAAGNQADDQFQRISIRDTTAPAFVFNSSFTEVSPETSCAAMVDLDMSVAGRLVEACNLVSVTNDAVTLYGNGNGTDDASGFYAPGSYTVTFTAQDACNAVTIFVVNFTVEDNTNPTVICHDMVNVTIPNSGTAILAPTTVIASVLDNCTMDNSSFTVTPSTFTNADFGLNPIVVSVSDVSGNTTICNSVADVAGSVEYDLAEVSGAAGSSINLPVVARHFTDINSFSMTVTLADPTVATITGVSDFHPSLTGTGNSNIINSGQVDVSYFDVSTTLADLDDVVLFNVIIQLNPLALPGDMTSVTLTDILNFRDDAAGNPQSVATLGFNGSAEVAAASALRTLAGNIRTITSPVENVDSVTVNLTGTTVNSMITTTDGLYSFDVPTGSSQTITPFKDINWRNGGNVNILDVLSLHRLSLGIDSYTSTSQEVAADSDGMNGVNILDVLLAHRISLSIIDEIPTNTSWRFVDSNLGVPTAPNTNGFPEGRTYNNIAADVTGADFFGIKICNVVDAASGEGLMSDNADERDEPLYFNLDNFDLVAGQDYAVEVKAKDFNHISAYQYNLLLDTEFAQLNSVTPGVISNMTLDNFNTLRSAEGIIGTDWYELHPLDVTDETVLFTLNFTAIQGGIQLSEILSIDSDTELAFHADGNNEVGDVELEFSTTTSVSPIADNDFALLQNKPNPFSSETIISFVLPQNAETTLTIIDVAGRTVFQTKTQALKGYNELKINAFDLPATGVFHYRLDSEVGTAVRKMIILR